MKTNKQWIEQAQNRLERFPSDMNLWIKTANICRCGTCFCCHAKKYKNEIVKGDKNENDCRIQ